MALITTLLYHYSLIREKVHVLNDENNAWLNTQWRVWYPSTYPITNVGLHFRVTPQVSARYKQTYMDLQLNGWQITTAYWISRDLCFNIFDMNIHNLICWKDIYIRMLSALEYGLFSTIHAFRCGLRVSFITVKTSWMCTRACVSALFLFHAILNLLEQVI